MFVLDAARYVLVTLLFALAGAGMLHVLRVPIARRTALLLGAALTQAAWGCAEGMIVTSGTRIGRVVLYVWLVTLALAAYGLFALYRGRWPAESEADTSTQVVRTDWILLGLSLALPFFSMAAYLGSGLTNYRGSGLSDGWAYIAVGQYLWNLPRGTEGGLAPLYQYASMLSYLRNVASGELAMLSVAVRPGEAYASAGLFQALTLFTLCSSCAAFIRARRPAASTAIVYLVLVGASGWIANLVWANNFDHAIALAYAPALATLIIAPRQPTLGTAAAAGLILAALTYTYPELAVMIAGSAGLVGLDRIWRDRGLRWLMAGAIALLVWLALVSPSLRDLWLFFWNQMHNAVGQAAAPRPGEGMFPGLLVHHYWPAALWGIGAEHNPVLFLRLQQLAALGLTMMLGVGVWQVFRRRELGLLTAILLFLAGAGLFAVNKAYDYGTYKVLLTGWWLTAAALADGWTGAVSWPRSARGRVFVVAAATLILLALPGSVAARNVLLVAKQLTLPTMEKYSGAEQVGRVLNGQPLAIVMGEGGSTYWAVYFLRDANMRMGTYEGYLTSPPIRRVVDRARVAPWPTIRYVMTDDASRAPGLSTGDGWIAVWHSGVYTLWDTRGDGWAAITDITHGPWNGKAAPLIRLDQDPLAITIIANRPGQVSLLATYAVPPGSPSGTRLSLRTPLASRTIDIMPGDLEITLPVTSGENVWNLSVAVPAPVQVDLLHPRVRWRADVPATTVAAAAAPAM